MAAIQQGSGVAGGLIDPAPAPVLAGPCGLRYDFNLGARLSLPPGNWRVRLSDVATHNTLFETAIEGGFVASGKKYYVPFRVEAWLDGEPVFDHTLSLSGREVLVQCPVGTLGDVLAWFPYADRFARQHGCRLSCSMSPALIPLFAGCYPEIRFLAPGEVDPGEFYATYYLGLFFDDDESAWQPADFRLVGLARTAGYILGVDPADTPARIDCPPGRPIAEPYACIAVQSTTQCKYWNNPQGWLEVVRALKARGLRVLCIDQKPCHGHGLTWTQLPNGAEDFTGDVPLAERARQLMHAELFVGLSSGLSWLAWSVGTPVVLISGFTHPTNEFFTPYRVFNPHACNSCWNDPRHRFDHADFFWCPRHQGSERQFECTRLITAAQVTDTIARVPARAQPARENDR
ncbi:autotransporter strand-loop-strand O-heptosyltransferase [Crenobacter intestini]|uniref:Autotransporter strand-loop-strand O-heptosyltransferase n=1 Tax=Crenobacter intestini TaxID=2563443 RepID=A0A4T0V184_9NEIS|nr:autotransporter strand-loop-strand O-heptosyltransferase [Crenobacter intestini]TIC85239.1 autotransporter strand-loop-strand O-heptosyltransferase [Crenobacter intestini]